MKRWLRRMLPWERRATQVRSVWALERHMRGPHAPTELTFTAEEIADYLRAALTRDGYDKDMPVRTNCPTCDKWGVTAATEALARGESPHAAGEAQKRVERENGLGPRGERP